MNDLKTRAVVLAAGKATRFKTKKSKLLFNICGRTMVLYPLKVLEELAIPMSVIVGYQAEELQQEITTASIAQVTYIHQTEQLGTGHAVASSAATWDKENILVLAGDTPLITKDLIEKLITEHHMYDATVSFLTTHVIDPTGYGRVIEQDGLYQIIEEKDCTDEQRNITCVNAGIYMMKTAFLQAFINTIEKSPVSGEFYFVDLIKKASDNNYPVRAIAVPFDYVRGVNTLQELWEVEQIKRSEMIKHWMLQGVRFELAQSIHIDLDVQIGAGSFIGTGAHLLRGTRIGEECFVGAFSIIANTVVGDNSTIHSHSVVQDSTIGCGVHVGPFARIREHVSLGDNAEIGNFVEVKNSTIAASSKAKHLSYIGDTDAGQGVNIGAGTITCNYDGFKKSRTTIEDNAFIGSNNTLVAPITVGKGSYTAAGSVLSKNVPEESLAIGRARQENKPGYAKKMKAKLQEKDLKKNDVESLDGQFNFRGAIKTETEHQENR